MTIVASQPANWERDQGFTVFQNMLQAHRGHQPALFACNDLMALGAVEAIAAAGRTGTIRVVGFDALDDARTAIEAGRMEASVAQSPRDMGRLAVESAAHAAQGRNGSGRAEGGHRAGDEGAARTAAGRAEASVGTGFETGRGRGAGAQAVETWQRS